MSVAVLSIVVFFVVWLQKKLYKRLWAEKVSFMLSFSEKTAFEGDMLTLTETLINAKFLPLPVLAAKFQVSRNLVFTDFDNFQVSDDYYRNDMFSILMFQKIIRKLPFECAKRGYYTIKSADLVSSSLLMNDKLARHIESDASLTVYPRLVDVDENIIPCQKIIGSVLARRLINPDPFEFKGIREYQPYDSFKSVNFKATAKANRLMVNVNDYTVSQEITLVLNLQKFGVWAGTDLFEHGIRLAASLAAYYIEEGIPLRMICNGCDIATGRSVSLGSGSGTGHLIQIYECLARVDLGLEVSPIADELLQDNWEREASRVVILISTYHEGDLQHVFEEIEQSGGEAYWIVPVFADMKLDMIENEKIIRYEVSINE